MNAVLKSAVVALAALASTAASQRYVGEFVHNKVSSKWPTGNHVRNSIALGNGFIVRGLYQLGDQLNIQQAVLIQPDSGATGYSDSETVGSILPNPAGDVLRCWNRGYSQYVAAAGDDFVVSDCGEMHIGRVTGVGQWRWLNINVVAQLGLDDTPNFYSSTPIEMFWDDSGAEEHRIGFWRTDAYETLRMLRYDSAAGEYVADGTIDFSGLTASLPSCTQQMFGFSISGSRVALSAAGSSNCRSVIFADRTGASTWAMNAGLTVTESSLPTFGTGSRLRGDFLAVVASETGTNVDNHKIGGTYLYKLNAGGTAYEQVFAKTHRGQNAYEPFTGVVDVSEDGGTVVACNHEFGNGNSGACAMYTETGPASYDNGYVLSDYIDERTYDEIAPDACGTITSFGNGVKMSPDGSAILTQPLNPCVFVWVRR